MVVAFLRDEIVVLRFTVTIVGATGFLVVFITGDVAFFVGLSVVTGLLVGFADAADVRLFACVVVAGRFVVAAGFFVR